MTVTYELLNASRAGKLDATIAAVPDDALLLESDLPDAESVDAAMAQIGGQLPRGGNTVVTEGRLLRCVRWLLYRTWQNPTGCVRARVGVAARFTSTAASMVSAAGCL